VTARCNGETISGEIISFSQQNWTIVASDGFETVEHTLRAREITVIADSHLFVAPPIGDLSVRLARQLLFAIARPSADVQRFWPLLVRLICDIGSGSGALLSPFLTDDFLAFALDTATWPSLTFEEAAAQARRALLLRGKFLLDLPEALGHLVFTPDAPPTFTTGRQFKFEGDRAALLPIRSWNAVPGTMAGTLAILVLLAGAQDRSIGVKIASTVLEKLGASDDFAEAVHAELLPRVLRLVSEEEVPGLAGLLDKVKFKSGSPDWQFCLLYRAELASIGDVPKGSRSATTVESVRCFSDLKRFPERRLAMAGARTTRLIQPTVDELKISIECNGYDRYIMKLPPNTSVDWGSFPEVVETEESGQRILTFDCTLRSSIELKFGCVESVIKTDLIRDEMSGTSEFASFIREHWETRFDESLGPECNSDKSEFEIAKAVLSTLVGFPRSFVFARLRMLRATQASVSDLMIRMSGMEVGPLWRLLESVPHVVPFRMKLGRLRKNLMTHATRQSQVDLKLDRARDAQALAGDQGMSFFDQITEQLPLLDTHRLVMRDLVDGDSELWSVKLENERGVDAGGLAREIFAKVCAELMLPQLGLFTLTPNGRRQAGKHQDLLVPMIGANSDRLAYAGVLCAMTIVAQQPQQFKLARLVWEFVKSGEMDIVSIVECDQEMDRIISAVKGCETGDAVEKLGLDFSVGDWSGNAVSLGPYERVTISNRDEFCRLYIESRKRQITPALVSFRSGFNRIIEAGWLKLFGPLEVEKMVCGERDFPIDRLRKMLGAKEDDANWTRLVTVLGRLSSQERFEFLAFATGSPSLLPDGFEQASISVDFKEGSLMPVSHTCMREIEIYTCSSDDELERMIRKALEFGGTFQLA
jgi:hypothetical protein